MPSCCECRGRSSCLTSWASRPNASHRRLAAHLCFTPREAYGSSRLFPTALWAACLPGSAHSSAPRCWVWRTRCVPQRTMCCRAVSRHADCAAMRSTSWTRAAAAFSASDSVRVGPGPASVGDIVRVRLGAAVASQVVDPPARQHQRGRHRPAGRSNVGADPGRSAGTQPFAHAGAAPHAAAPRPRYFERLWSRSDLRQLFRRDGPAGRGPDRAA